jgi:hypothetical protein
MTSRGLFKTVIAGSIAIGLTAATPSVGAQPNCPPAPATNPTQQQLDDARKLFQEAFKDEQDGKYEDALRKFQDVAKVKESASVKYRIAKNQANLGRLREARDSMRALAGSIDCLPQKDKNIAASAATEAVELEKKIPKLNVKVQDKAPNDTRITVDGAPVPSTGTGKPVELDPGDHTVSASASGMKPFQQTVKLGPSANETVTVQFEATQVANNDDKPVVGGDTKSEGRGALPYVLLIGGGLAAFAGSVFLILREGTISDIEKTCPLFNGRRVCPTRTQADIKDKQDQAELFMPLGITFLAVGAVAAGAGVYFLVRPTKSAESPPANGTRPATNAQSLHVKPPGIAPIRGGMMLGLSATF